MNKNSRPTELGLITGTKNYHRLNRKCLMTDGAVRLAESAGAYWLMDAAASYLLELGTYDWFVQISLTVEDATALLVLEDGNGKVRAQQLIPYTDFPLQPTNLYACWNGEFWVLMLPSEY